MARVNKTVGVSFAFALCMLLAFILLLPFTTNGFLQATEHILVQDTTMPAQKPLGPYKLVSVNTAPERAKRLIGRVVEDVKDKYIIIHAGNADSKRPQHREDKRDRSMLRVDRTDMEQVKEVVTREQPDILVCWPSASTV